MDRFGVDSISVVSRSFLDLLRLAAARCRIDGKPLARPFQDAASDIRIVKELHAGADREAARHPVFYMNREHLVATRQLHRYRIYDADGDVSIIRFPSGRDLVTPQKWQRKDMPLLTDRAEILDISQAGTHVLQDPWQGRKPVFFFMHGDDYGARASWRLPARARAEMSAKQLRLTSVRVKGAAAADMLWETGSFQIAITKDPSRPVVCMICKPPAVFAEQFSDRMFENGFKAPIYVGRGDVLVATRTIDGAQVSFPLFEQTVRGENPIAEFWPPRE